MTALLFLLSPSFASFFSSSSHTQYFPRPRFISLTGTQAWPSGNTYLWEKKEAAISNSFFLEALGRCPSTVPFPALIDTQPREESLCTWPVDMVLNVSVDPALRLQAVLPYTWTRYVTASHCWCLCEHSYKLEFQLEFHWMPVPGQTWCLEHSLNVTATLYISAWFMSLYLHDLDGEARV